MVLVGSLTRRRADVTCNVGAVEGEPGRGDGGAGGRRRAAHKRAVGEEEAATGAVRGRALEKAWSGGVSTGVGAEARRSLAWMRSSSGGEEMMDGRAGVDVPTSQHAGGGRAWPRTSSGGGGAHGRQRRRPARTQTRAGGCERGQTRAM